MCEEIKKQTFRGKSESAWTTPLVVPHWNRKFGTSKTIWDNEDEHELQDDEVDDGDDASDDDDLEGDNDLSGCIGSTTSARHYRKPYIISVFGSTTC
jgi:hypothetical protein